MGQKIVGSHVVVPVPSSSSSSIPMPVKNAHSIPASVPSAAFVPLPVHSGNNPARINVSALQRNMQRNTDDDNMPDTDLEAERQADDVERLFERLGDMSDISQLQEGMDIDNSHKRNIEQANEESKEKGNLNCGAHAGQFLKGGNLRQS